MGAVKTDLRTTKETIQKIGDSDAIVPNKIAVDLGVTDLFITNQAQDIGFTGKGEKTNVGERIPTTTQGMSVNGAGVDRLRVAKTKEPARGGVRKSLLVVVSGRYGARAG